jgi:hypothetical protein
MLPTPVCEYNYVLPSLKIKLGCGWLMYVLRYMRWTIDGTYARRGAGGRTGWIGICGEQLYACAAAISRARMGNAATAHGVAQPFLMCLVPSWHPRALHGSYRRTTARRRLYLELTAQLQRSEQAEDSISLISRNLEATALEMVKGGCQNIYRLL